MNINFAYTKPKKLDMAICIIFFNPTNSKRMIMNYFFMCEKIRIAGLPVFTMELTFGNNPRTIYDSIVVKGNSYLFHKERLCRLLEKMVPPFYSKICFLDADILFENSNWYNETSTLLDTHEVVQPFDTACWLDLTYKKVTLQRVASSLMPKDPVIPIWEYHPGFAWAFQRSWYNKIGFYDFAITGGGDTLAVAAWTKLPAIQINTLRKAHMLSYDIYKSKIKESPKISSTRGRVFHLYHGSVPNRKYVIRHQWLDDIQDIRNIIRENEFGVYEFVEDKYNQIMKKYFDERDDDSL